MLFSGKRCRVSTAVDLANSAVRQFDHRGRDSASWLLDAFDMTNTKTRRTMKPITSSQLAAIRGGSIMIAINATGTGQQSGGPGGGASESAGA